MECSRYSFGWIPFSKHKNNPVISLSWADLGGGVGWVDSHPPFWEAKQKKLEKNVNTIANALVRYASMFWCNSFLLTSFSEHAFLILQPHGKSHPLLKYPGSAPASVVSHRKEMQARFLISAGFKPTIFWLDWRTARQDIRNHTVVGSVSQQNIVRSSNSLIFNNKMSKGYSYHSVFQVLQQSCLVALLFQIEDQWSPDWNFKDTIINKTT